GGGDLRYLACYAGRLEWLAGSQGISRLPSSRMSPAQPIVLASVLLVGIAGCGVPRQMTIDRDAVRRALPRDVTLDMVVRPSLDRDDTVEKELIRVGAYVDGSGTLRDRAGREIRFAHQTRPPGNVPPPRPPSPEDLRQRAEWEKFRKEFAVIDITWNQSFEPSPP